MAKKLIIIILGLILIGFAGTFGYWYSKTYHTKKLINNFIQRNLKEEFWPLNIQIKPIQNNSFLASWVLGERSFTVSGGISSQKKSYAINIFIPNQEIINQSQKAQKIYKFYFTFSPEFTCERLPKTLEQQAFRCFAFGDNKSFFIFSDAKGTTLSLMETK